MRRRLLIILSIASLLFCIASIVTWKWSFSETASRVLTTQPWVELDLVDGHLQWLKITGLTVDRREHWVDNWEFRNQPRKLPDDWGIRFFNDGRFLQFTGDGRLVTSEPILLPIVRSLAFDCDEPQTTPGMSRTTGTFSRHGHVEIRSASIMLFALLFSILPAWVIARWIGRRSRHEYRQRAGLNPCKQCGYNLTGVCPECGTAAAAYPELPAAL